MSRSRKRVSLVLAAGMLLVQAAAYGEGGFAGVGRAATPREIAAWDIDVRADFKGLPPGAGSVAFGMKIWDGKCASCHGSFGESNQVFTPIVGGTTQDDIRTGRVANLADNRQPQRTSMMKLSTVSTLWDYINRAMPWAAPKTLTTEEVYAVTAYILHMAEIVPDDFVLSDRNIGEVQQRLPNRYGMTQQHGMWRIDGEPDVRNTACMKNCVSEVRITSGIPDYARNAHGNLALQHRTIGPVRGVDTEGGASARIAVSSETGGAALAKQHGCIACHGVDNRIVGPSFKEIAKRYAGTQAQATELERKIRQGGAGAWGEIPMPAQTSIEDGELQTVLKWILALAP